MIINYDFFLSHYKHLSSFLRKFLLSDTVFLNISFVFVKYYYCLSLLREIWFFFSDSSEQLKNLSVISDKLFSIISNVMYNKGSLIVFEFYVNNYFLDLILPLCRVANISCNVSLFTPRYFVETDKYLFYRYNYLLTQFSVLSNDFLFFVDNNLSFTIEFHLKVFNFYFEVLFCRFVFCFISIVEVMELLNSFFCYSYSNFYNIGSFFYNKCLFVLEKNNFFFLNIFICSRSLLLGSIGCFIKELLSIEFSIIRRFGSYLGLHSNYMFSSFTFTIFVLLTYIQYLLFVVLDSQIIYLYVYKLYYKCLHIVSQLRLCFFDKGSINILDSNNMLLNVHSELLQIFSFMSVRFPFFDLILVDVSKHFIGISLWSFKTLLLIFTNVVRFFVFVIKDVFSLDFLDISIFSNTLIVYNDFSLFLHSFIDVVLKLNLVDIQFDEFFIYKLYFVYYVLFIFFFVNCSVGNIDVDFEYFISNKIFSYLLNCSSVVTLNPVILLQEICRLLHKVDLLFK